jgi:hypothetical protein
MSSRAIQYGLHNNGGLRMTVAGPKAPLDAIAAQHIPKRRWRHGSVLEQVHGIDPSQSKWLINTRNIGRHSGKSREHALGVAVGFLADAGALAIGRHVDYDPALEISSFDTQTVRGEVQRSGLGNDTVQKFMRQAMRTAADDLKVEALTPVFFPTSFWISNETVVLLQASPIQRRGTLADSRKLYFHGHDVTPEQLLVCTAGVIAYARADFDRTESISTAFGTIDP